MDVRRVGESVHDGTPRPRHELDDVRHADSQALRCADRPRCPAPAFLHADVFPPDSTALDLDALHRDGYVLLRAAIPASWLDGLRASFDAGVRASHDWPVPRGADWRHAVVDLDPTVQAVCRQPAVIDAARALIGERFFLAQVEGREPLPGGGHQSLHRDLSATRPGDTVNAIAFFDDYGAHNGATRLVPGSHRPPDRDAPIHADEDARVVQIAGRAGDILVFDADLLHAASTNVDGARRRSILFGYFAAPLYEAHLRTRTLRHVRMDVAWFDA